MTDTGSKIVFISGRVEWLFDYAREQLRGGFPKANSSLNICRVHRKMADHIKSESNANKSRNDGRLASQSGSNS